MKPEQKSKQLLAVTRSKAKMHEYRIPEDHHIEIKRDPAKLFTLSIGLLGDLTAAINSEKFAPEDLNELQSNLLFSAQFFDAYVQSKLDETLDPYLILIGAASYYLCDQPGSASVLAKRINDCPNLGGEGLENLLLWLLQANHSTYFEGSKEPFGKYIDGISRFAFQFFENGSGEENFNSLATKLRANVYESGTARQLLFSDIIAAILRKKTQNSSWNALPLYSGISKEKWQYSLQKESFIKELWPAQHLLGQSDVLKGKSAIVQMPTSAGKTKAIELILRSTFLAERTSLAIIVAPFRALCHEIKNSLVEAFRNEPTKVDELSDVFQTDFDIAGLFSQQQILIITPEKLVYVLRHAPELASHVGLLIFDEGHQFDNGTRGITYELLLTSLRSMIPEEAQQVLISAVISNAGAIGEWLSGEAHVVEGTNLSPMFRSVGFTSWLDRLGRIEYVDSQNTEQGEFFVPRVIETFNLGRKGKETKDRLFPLKSEGQSIALYLGMKLALNGSIAIFCGLKTTAASICEKALDAIERGIPLEKPLKYSNEHEVSRLHNLHIRNLGAATPASKCARYGIFSHHANIPHGIRLSVEHAMREDFVRFVVCTSTLAQGVNLPIRYLIITSVYQAGERIKVRDFHNLIGRAGRAGMHTEGSILFADPVVYDKKRVRSDKWRWKQVKELLEPSNSEPCISNLLSIFEPIKSDNEKYYIPMEALGFIRAYIGDPDEIFRFGTKIVESNSKLGFTNSGVKSQITWKINLVCTVESYLLSNWEEAEDGLSENDVILLAEGTLAFFLAEEQKQENIRELFKLLAENISATIPEATRKQVYSRTLYGLRDAQAIEEWVQANVAQLLLISNEEEALDITWSLLKGYINNSMFKRFDNPGVLSDVAHEWIEGKSFIDLLDTIHQQGVRMIWGTKPRDFKVEHVVEVCEGALAYDGALLVGALCEFIGTLDQEGTNDLISCMQLFQKRLKYGLPTETTIALYELGFSDRVVSQDLATSLNISATLKSEVLLALKQNKDIARDVISKYPLYFQERMKSLLL